MRFCGEEAVVTVYNKHENGERIITRLATVPKGGSILHRSFLRRKCVPYGWNNQRQTMRFDKWTPSSRPKALTFLHLPGHI
jgi:hypothetical protein